MFKEICEAAATAILITSAVIGGILLTSQDMCERISPHDSMASSACVRSEIQSLADRAEGLIKEVTGNESGRSSAQSQR